MCTCICCAPRYFSYEHFYVIYCKFWELDSDHDFLIDKDDLLRYGNHALTYRIVERIFAQVRGRHRRQRLAGVHFTRWSIFWLFYVLQPRCSWDPFFIRIA